MKIGLVCIAFFCFGDCSSQTASFKEIKYQPNPAFYKTNEQTIVYPVISTGKANVDVAIAKEINYVLFNSDDQDSINSLLQKEINENGLIGISYTVSYNKNGVLSIQFELEACGAHCSSWTAYFNFDLKSGNQLLIDDFIDKTKLRSFEKMILNDKVSALKKYKVEQKTALKNGDIDTSVFNWITETVDECMGSVDVTGFSILEKGLEINDVCEFPYAIRSLQPVFSLKYSYENIATFIKPTQKWWRQ